MTRRPLLLLWFFCCLPLCFYSVPRIRHYAHLQLTPKTTQTITEGLSQSALDGREEYQLLNSIRSQYFYFVPVYKKALKKHRKGAFRVISYNEGRTVMIDQPESGFSIRLRYNLQKNQKRIIRKSLYGPFGLIDRITYEYGPRGMTAAVSRIHGVHFFLKPRNRCQGIWWFIRERIGR